MIAKQNYKYQCIFCGRTSDEVIFNREHIIPQNVGGCLYMDNVVCKDCNSKLGSQVDIHLIRFPEVLKAIDSLELNFDIEEIINKHYNITGKANKIELKSGQFKDKKLTFHEQRISDGSMILPEDKYINVLENILKKKNNKLKDVASNNNTIKIIDEVQNLYEKAAYGETIGLPGIGCKVRKCSEKFSINVAPKGEVDIHPLIAKIAYEIIYFFEGDDFFRDENIELRENFLSLIFHRKKTGNIFIIQTEAKIRDFQPVHLIGLEMHKQFTLVRVAFFGHIEFILLTKSLPRSFVEKLEHALKVSDLYAILYQQELGNVTKSFWVKLKNTSPYMIWKI